MYQLKRIIMAFLGVTLCGFCVGMLQKANLGVDPFTCFVTGIANIFSSTYSTFYLILTGTLLLLVLILRRHYIGIATIINLLFTGIAADAIALIAAYKYQLLPFKYCRIITDSICVLVGFAFNVTLGVGTIITALFMGPLTQWFKIHIAEPILAHDQVKTVL